MKRTRQRRSGAFTLIEMLVVLVIIFILAAIVLKVMGLVGLKTAESRCQYELQQLRNALNEFYAEYGHYPPVNFVAYEYESATNQGPWFRDVFLPPRNNASDPASFFPDTRDGRDPGELGYSANPQYNGESLHCRYGLVSFLWHRRRGGQVHWFDDDTDRDRAAKDRWAHFLEGLLDGGQVPHHIQLQNEVLFTNSLATVNDPWGREYRYRCPPPFLRYKLWSAGPDGSDGTPDDILASNE